ncbi:MAG: bifunctional riboflavin kinase/FAD synthetase [Reinekea sp.]
MPQQAIYPAAVTIGSFDGVHLGHQQIIHRLTDHAKQHGLHSVVVTFEPQPREYLAPDSAPARLSSLTDKALQLAKLGLDQLVVLPFNQQLRALSAQQFVEDILVGKLNTRWLQVGDDFRFGNDRKGNIDFLRQFDFDVTDLPSQCLGGERISSTLIRERLESADFRQAEQMLGHPYVLSGRVVYGRQLGRTIGVPTANVLLPHKKLPTEGVFAVFADIDGQRYQGVANLGPKPTVGDYRRWLETHFFDYDGHLYGERLTVALHQRLRPIQKFDNFDALKSQIQHDIQAAKAWFATDGK